MGSKYNNPDYIGKKYGFLTVIGIEHSEKLKKYMWRCRCGFNNCNNEIVVDPCRLTIKKDIKSCGCYRKSCKTGLSKREYGAKWMRENRKWLKEHKMCIKCKSQDSWTLIGHQMCFECNQKRRKTPFEVIDEKEQKIQKIPKAEWNDYGLCSHCGKNPIKKGIRPYANVPYKVCEECYQHCLKMRKAYKDKYDKYGIRYIYPPHIKSKKAIETYRSLLNDQKERRKIFEADQEQRTG